MKGIIAVTLLGVVSSANCLANTVNYHFSALTDGNRHSHYVDADGNYTDTTAYDVGILQLNEQIGFSWDEVSTDGRTLSYGNQTYQELNTIFGSVDFPVANGLLSDGLTPGFVPDSEGVYPNVAATLSWLSFLGTDVGLGTTRFEFAVNWNALQIDSVGAVHLFSYARSYSFQNFSLLASADDLLTFNEQLFQQLVSHPDSQRAFEESVTETVIGCNQADVCGRNGTWVYSVSGTFDFWQINAVPEPSSLAIISMGGLLFAARARRKIKSC